MRARDGSWLGRACAGTAGSPRLVAGVPAAGIAAAGAWLLSGDPVRALAVPVVAMSPFEEAAG